MKCTKTVCNVRTIALAGVVVMGLLAPASAAVFLGMAEGDTEIGQNQGGFGVFTPGTYVWAAFRPHVTYAENEPTRAHAPDSRVPTRQTGGSATPGTNRWPNSLG